jgi:hypothetical protein
MARFRIPEQYASGLATIRQLDDAAMEQFLSVLSKAAPSLNTSALASAVSSSVKSIPQEDIEEMLVAVVSLYGVLDQSDLSMESFTDEFCQAMAESKRKNLNFDGEADRKRFRDRLTQLLSVDSFSIASKALSLKQEYEHYFCSGRILSDARPVYGDDLVTGPLAALIVHTLRLAYHEVDGIKEIYIAFDDSQLRELRDLLDRAELKSKNIRALLERSGTRVVGTREEDTDV